MTLPHFKFYLILFLFILIISFHFRLIDYFILDLDFADCAENCRMDGVTDNVHETLYIIHFLIVMNTIRFSLNALTFWHQRKSTIIQTL